MTTVAGDMQIGYARVSTKEQSFDLEVDALRKAGCEKVYQEVVSGTKAARPVLDALLRDLRPGDVLVIWKLDRLLGCGRRPRPAMHHPA
jgi:DNA invertase Pin-like site-specific DNA recombinase